MSIQEQVKTESNVVSLLSFKKAEAAAHEAKMVGLDTAQDSSEEESFENTMKRNEETKDRLRKERLKANQAVLRSYRIKN